MSTPKFGPVGLIGTGLMGAAMSSRLLDQGFDLLLFNRTAAKAQAIADATPDPAPGRAQVVAHPRDIAAAPCIALVLTDEKATRAILEGKDGLLAALTPAHILVHLGTIGPRAARAIAAAVTATGAAYLDAPVLGSTQAASSGQLLVFAGGDPATLDRARPLITALSRTVYPTGPIGSASSLKLIANMLLARYVEALGESLALAQKFDLDPVQLLDMLQASALASPMWEKGRTLLTGPMPLHFPAEHMAKDLRLLDEEVERLGLSLPAHEAVKALYEEALSSGLKGKDYSEIARFVAKGLPST